MTKAIPFADANSNGFGTPQWYARVGQDRRLVAQCARCGRVEVVAGEAPEGYGARRGLVEAWWERHALGEKV